MTYRIFFKGDQLHLQQKKTHRPYPGGILFQKEKDVFSVGRIFLNFDRENKDSVPSFTVNAGRVKNIRFVKQ